MTADKITRALGQFDSATVANAIEHFKVRDPTIGYANNELICHTPEISVPMVGYAVTCTVDSTTPGDTRPSRVDELIGLVAELEKPFVLVALYEGPDRSRSCMFGDMFCTMLAKLGGVGIVTDANGRDLSGIKRRTVGFHVFCRGWVVSHGYPAFINFNMPLTICGLNVNPGDLLHGDESGLVSVPLSIASDIASRAKTVHEDEVEFFKFLEKDAYTIEQLQQRINPRKGSS